MEKQVVTLAVRIIRQSSRENPADAALRENTRKSELSPERLRLVVQAVFDYFRWLPWLDPSIGIGQQLDEMETLQARGVSDAELRQLTLPNWVSSVMPVEVVWLRSLQQQPRLWLRVRRGFKEKLMETLGDCVPASDDYPAALEYLGRKDLFRESCFQEGWFEIQDISSQAIGHVCNPQAGETWWDACAGEGGKTLHLADLMANKGLIWASDPAAWRLERLKRRTARAQVFNYRRELWDGGAKLPTKTKFDGILVDAPCSGVGTWQRNPHARWTSSPEEVARLAELQINILRHAMKGLKPNGRLVYSVCTLTTPETEGVVAAVNESCPELQLQTQKLLWPYDAGGNGMFYAVWIRRSIGGA